MDLFRLVGRRTRPAVVALALAALAVTLAVPARAAPGRPGPTTLAGARAEAARLQQEVARLDLKVETPAESYAATQARREAARRAMVASAAARARALGFADLADAPAPNRIAAAAVRTALGQVGKPYRWGATGPASFDCSGLVRFAYADAGLSLSGTSRQQWSAGRHVRVADLRPGDLVFWAHDPADPATIHHVGMYVGQGLMVHAPHTGALVRVDAVRPGGYTGATRPG